MFTTENKTSINQGWLDKYRPKSLKEVVGQDKVVKEIVKRLNSKGGLNQNILLTGQTGTGKTTIGIILAQTLNCQHTKTEVINELNYTAPCGECKSCRAIANNEDNSGFHFYDGSDLNKEKILSLKNLCNSPNLYQGKIIIFIDELQNVSSGRDASLQAILKLIEHDYKGKVYFIFSTMSPSKINRALKDRFHHHFNLKPVSPADLITRSQVILKAEGLLDKVDFSNLEQNTDFISTFLKDGLPHLASAETGSVRSFIQHLETCVYRELGTGKEIEEELELMSVESSSDILVMLITKDSKFFEAISSVKSELDNFFNLSYNTLADYNYFYHTGKAVLAWQKAKYEIWKSRYHNNIIQLTKVYNKIFESSIYYKKNYFINKLITDYFTEASEEPIPTMIRRRRTR